jgi:hypothetical protein
MPDDESVTFTAYYPNMQSAIMMDGNNNGSRIKLDIPESEIANWIKSTIWRGIALKVTIEPIRQEENNGACLTTINRTTAKQRKQ